MRASAPPMMDASRSSPVRFGVFELDLRSGELRRSGTRVPLAEQPFRVLACLIQHAGDVVTRDELRQELWPADTFVDFDHGLNVAIRRVRDALGDDAEAPRFVETLPKRGYRFIAPVTGNAAGEQTPSAELGAPPPQRGMRRRIAIWASAAVAVALFAIAAPRLWHRGTVLTDRDTVLLEDFVNRTGDEVFDDMLWQGMAAQLQQSPFIAIVSRERVRQTLRQMTRSPDENVSGSVAREVCQRLGAKVTIGGNIASLGRTYVVGLEAVDCASGQTVATEQGEASSKEEVLAALGTAATSLRRRLGESLPSIQQHDVPIRQGTTGSFDALKTFSSAMTARDKGDYAAAVRLLERAVEIDPEFALAWAHLSSELSATGRRRDANEALARAFARRDRVAEHERYYISHRYHVMQGDVPKALEVSEAWAQVYPRSWLPHDNLCKLSWQLWNTDRALAECREAIRLEPASIYPYEGLIVFSTGLGRMAEARDAANALLATGLNDAVAHARLAEIAWLADDTPALEWELAWLRTRSPAAYDERRQEQSLAAGKLRDAAAIRPLPPSALAFVGRVADARSQAAQMLHAWQAASGSAPPIDPLLTMGLVGDATWLDRADPAARALPAHVALHHVLVPSARAAVELSRGNARKAIELLDPARRYGFGLGGFTATYLRGLAFLQDRQPREAAAEFERIAAHRGISPGSVLWPLAHLGVARARALDGDIAASLHAYEHFLALWSRGDPDLPVLQQARAEYERLKTSPAR